jgi:hypothetical protein
VFWFSVSAENLGTNGNNNSATLSTARFCDSGIACVYTFNVVSRSECARIACAVRSDSPTSPSRVACVCRKLCQPITGRFNFTHARCNTRRSKFFGLSGAIGGPYGIRNTRRYRCPGFETLLRNHDIRRREKALQGHQHRWLPLGSESPRLAPLRN